MAPAGAAIPEGANDGPGLSRQTHDPLARLQARLLHLQRGPGGVPQDRPLQDGPAHRRQPQLPLPRRVRRQRGDLADPGDPRAAGRPGHGAGELAGGGEVAGRGARAARGRSRDRRPRHHQRGQHGGARPGTAERGDRVLHPHPRGHHRDAAGGLVRPGGHHTDVTLGLLAEAGYLWSGDPSDDDVPYVASVNGRRICVIPKTWYANDWRAWGNGLGDAGTFFTGSRTVSISFTRRPGEAGPA